MKTILMASGLAGLLPLLAFAQAFELERELNEQDVEVKVIELDTELQPGIESGRVQVMITNLERHKVACQLHPGDTEADPGLDASPISIIVPGGRGVLSMSGEYGDSTLDALLTCVRDE